ncbi:MAG: DUF2252 domain-containing protein [Candidatus Dormibacteraeota bacterium]|nr:DUF2252 domain-containing protein [Candidatus Dormibacteraeota bacterium]
MADLATAAPPAIKHLSVEERTTLGRAERAEVPRSVHAVWAAPTGRQSPVDLLEEQARSRVPELVPVRHGRMLVSPFSFFRGAALIMAADLAGLPRTALHVQLCGDAHLSNFGGFAAPDRRLTFSINDFDETLPGPFEWDLKRLVASFAVAGRDRGFNATKREAVNLEVARSYRVAMRAFAGMRNLDVWYSRLDIDDIVQHFAQEASATAVRRFQQNVASARAKDSLKALAKLTETVDGRLRIVSDSPIIVPVEEIAGPETGRVGEDARALLRSYRRTLQGDRRHLLERYQYVHAARKVVGVGSVGTRAWIILLTGRDQKDPLFLQAKEAEPSVLERFLGRSLFANHGQRVVEGQRLMQAASDIMLGWIRARGVDGVERDFYFRQLWDQKGSPLVELMSARTMRAYAQVCGWSLARAHARSGDAVAIAGYLGAGDGADRALASFAERYADQNERDYSTFKDAVNRGRLPAQRDL